MQIGSPGSPVSHISQAYPDRVEVRGRDLCGDLMGRLSFTEYFHLLLTGREPTDEELAIELQIPTSKVAHLKSVSVRPASLDAPIGEDGDSATFGEIVGDDNAVNPFDGLRDKNQNSDLHAMVDSLDEREAEIIKLRFGLDGKDELTLEEVGKKFHVTRERIRQLEYLALSKMRRAMTKHEAVRTTEEIEEDERVRQRNVIIRDFIEAKSRKPAKAGRN